jgi:hypothetical protein
MKVGKQAGGCKARAKQGPGQGLLTPEHDEEPSGTGSCTEKSAETADSRPPRIRTLSPSGGPICCQLASGIRNSTKKKKIRISSTTRR